MCSLLNTKSKRPISGKDISLNFEYNKKINKSMIKQNCKYPSIVCHVIAATRHVGV